jgi:ubiquinone/menaquinone biosynthesis C-methylase UbiE
VVELGCGNGAIAHRLDELGFVSNYRGFDISDSGISQAVEINSANLSFSVAAAPVPLADNSADLVVMSHVVEHLEHPRELILEARRIAPTVIVEVPLEVNRRLPEDYDWNPVGHINKYDRKTIRQLIQTCQFDILDQFTTCPSKHVMGYRQPGLKSYLKWALKQTTLVCTPRFARSQFTYHETLLATRNDAAHPRN